LAIWERNVTKDSSSKRFDIYIHLEYTPLAANSFEFQRDLYCFMSSPRVKQEKSYNVKSHRV